MATYLTRYIAGEHEAVWRELQALGASVREEPVYSDALAVARETMRRVRVNTETLVARLTELGYRFGFDGEWQGETCTGERVLTDFVPPPLAPPPADSAARLDRIEQEHGPLALSLRAFYETMGSIDLRGYFPINEAEWVRHDTAALHQENYWVPETLDPLQIFALAEASDTDPEFEEESGYRTLFLSADPLAKMGYSAVGSLEVIVPCRTADVMVWLEEPYDHEDMWFVTGLRRAFRFGGFNHFSTVEESDSGRETDAFLRALRTPTGESYLDFLTRDLLPL